MGVIDTDDSVTPQLADKHEQRSLRIDTQVYMVV